MEETELAKRLAISPRVTTSDEAHRQELVTFDRFPYSGSRVTQETKPSSDQAVSYMELEDFPGLTASGRNIGGQRQQP